MQQSTMLSLSDLMEIVYFDKSFIGAFNRKYEEQNEGCGKLLSLITNNGDCMDHFYSLQNV